MRSLFALAALVLALSIEPNGQTRYGPAASTRVLGGPVVTLETGAPDWGAYTSAFNLLRMAGVRFVLEGAGFSPGGKPALKGRPTYDTYRVTR
jgi:hypothetical protein